MIALALAAQLTCSSLELRNAICWALCRRDGYDTGHYVAKSRKCLCGSERDYSDFTKPSLFILEPRPTTYD
jgi:hypothetical protein